MILEGFFPFWSNTIAGIGFFKINYADGNAFGSTEFDEKIHQHFKEMLVELDLP